MFSLSFSLSLISGTKGQSTFYAFCKESPIWVEGFILALTLPSEWLCASRLGLNT